MSAGLQPRLGPWSLGKDAASLIQSARLRLLKETFNIANSAAPCKVPALNPLQWRTLSQTQASAMTMIQVYSFIAGVLKLLEMN